MVPLSIGSTVQKQYHIYSASLLISVVYLEIVEDRNHNREKAGRENFHSRLSVLNCTRNNFVT